MTPAEKYIHNGAIDLAVEVLDKEEKICNDAAKYEQFGSGQRKLLDQGKIFKGIGNKIKGFKIL